MRNFLKNLLWSAFLLYGPCALFSLPPTENAHGIIVKFRSSEKGGYAKRDKLHGELGTQLLYRPQRSPFDFVVPKTEDKQRDFSLLTKLCETYQSASIVESCEINYDLVARNESSSTGQACTLSPSHGAPLLKNGTLSPFWAQELVGADLVAFPRAATKMGFAVKVAVIDQDFGETGSSLPKKVPAFSEPATSTGIHGALSLGLLTGPVPYSLQAPIQITHLFEARNAVDFLKILETLNNARPMPGIIHISVSLGRGSRAVAHALKRLSEKSILVAATGNEWPNEPDPNEKNFPGILVGSLTPEGYLSHGTQSEFATVAAPSDSFLQSTVDGKKPENFGGSSGASALVTTVVAAAKSLLPDLTTDEAKILLRKTAIPTPSSRGEVQAPGGLNAVLMLAVADRMRAQGIEGPQRTKALASEPGTRVFKFEKESEVELAKGIEALANPKATCEQRTVAFNQVRRAFFLNPNGPARVALSDLYTKERLAANAVFTQNVDKETLMKRLASDIGGSDPGMRISAARAAAGMGAEGLDLVTRFAEGGVRSPASDSGVPVTAGTALRAMSRQWSAETRKTMAGRLKAHRNDDLQEVGEALSK